MGRLERNALSGEEVRVEGNGTFWSSLEEGPEYPVAVLGGIVDAVAPYMGELVPSIVEVFVVHHSSFDPLNEPCPEVDPFVLCVLVQSW